MVSLLPNKEETREKIYYLLEMVNKEKENFCVIPNEDELLKLENLLNAYSCNELTLEDVRNQVLKVLNQPSVN